MNIKKIMSKYLNNKRNKIVLILILIIGLLATLFFYLYSNKKIIFYKLNLNKNIILSDNGWNKYMNKDLNFEINYPNKEYPLGKLKYIDKVNPIKGFYSIIFFDGGSTQITIDVKNSQYKTIDELIKNIILKKENLVLEKIKISEEDAIVYYYDLGDDYIQTSKDYRDVFVTTAFVIKDNKLYTITTANIDKSDLSYIWNSFKFLD